MSTGVTAQINLAALQHNLQRVRDYAPSSAVMAMIKANAYGHGLLPVARALSAADGLGVARLEEALVLRHNQVHAAIAVMAGFLDEKELTQMAALDISAVIHTPRQVQLLESATLNKALRVWIKIDSGMHRLGIQPSQVAEVYQRISTCRNVQKPIGLMTHFAQADEVDNNITQAQMVLFSQLTPPAPLVKSLANSAGIIAWPNSHQDWVRPGIMLYGVSPFAGTIGDDFGLKPVMTLQSQLIARHNLVQHEATGYGGTWICPEDMPVGIAAVGYGDGYPRHVKNGTAVLVNGQRCAVAGRVSMDLLIIDLRNNPHAQIGDPVILWGDGLPIEEVASSAETIAYELLCHVARRVRFVYV